MGDPDDAVTLMMPMMCPWRLVRANRGSPGVDGINFEGIEREIGVHTFLEELESSNSSGLEIGACQGVKNIGKPCAGKPHARFDEGGQARACSLLYPPIPKLLPSSSFKLEG